MLVQLTAGEELAAEDICFQDSSNSGNAYIANATNCAGYPLWMACRAIKSGDKGPFTDDKVTTISATAGKQYFLATASRAITDDPDNDLASTNYVRKVGTGLRSGYLRFQPSGDYGEHP